MQAAVSEDKKFDSQEKSKFLHSLAFQVSKVFDVKTVPQKGVAE